MKRRLSRLEQAATPHQPASTIIWAIPPDDLPAHQYDTWAAGVAAEARRDRRRLISLNIGHLHGTATVAEEDPTI
jgi:hypothetical protein